MKIVVWDDAVIQRECSYSSASIEKCVTITHQVSSRKRLTSTISAISLARKFILVLSLAVRSNGMCGGVCSPLGVRVL